MLSMVFYLYTNVLNIVFTINIKRFIFKVNLLNHDISTIFSYWYYMFVKYYLYKIIFLFTIIFDLLSHQ